MTACRDDFAQHLFPGARVEGSLRLNGQELVGLPDDAMAALRGDRVAMVFQEPMTALNPLHTVGAQVAEPLRLHRGLDRSAARAEALRLLDRVQLPDAARRLDAYPHQLSGGQRQRVMIAMMLIPNPDLLIADEPTSALDVTVQAEVLSILDGLVRDRGMGLIFISHDLRMVARFCDRVLVMNKGRIVEEIAASDLLRAKHPYTQGLLNCLPRIGGSRDPLPSLDRTASWAREGG